MHKSPTAHGLGAPQDPPLHPWQQEAHRPDGPQFPSEDPGRQGAGGHRKPQDPKPETEDPLHNCFNPLPLLQLLC